MRYFALLFLAMLLVAGVFSEYRHHPCDVMLENLRAKRQYHLVLFEFTINHSSSVSSAFLEKADEAGKLITAYEEKYASHCITPMDGFDDVFTRDNKIGK